MASTGYQSNNLSDEVKYTNLTNLAREIIDRGDIPYVTYFELHSGAGRYRVNGEVCDGSAIRVLRLLRSESVVHEAHLHEKNSNLRSQLEENVEPFNDHGQVCVYRDWKDEIEEHVHSRIGVNPLFMLDPTHLADYCGDDGLLCWLGPVLAAGASVFMYAPQNVGSGFPRRRKHARILSQIRGTIRSRYRTGLDLMHYAGSGYHERVDHNIIAAEPSILMKLKASHRDVCKRLKTLKKGYPSFREIR